MHPLCTVPDTRVSPCPDTPYATELPYKPHVGGCQNYGRFLGTLNIRGRIIIGIQKGTISLTTTHIISIHTCLHDGRMTATRSRLRASCELPRGFRKLEASLRIPFTKS